MSKKRLLSSAEEYHQKYLDKNPTGYCHISPAMMNIKKQKQDIGITRPFLLFHTHHVIEATKVLPSTLPSFQKMQR